MKMEIAFTLAVASAMAITFPTAAQTFSGTNAPNTGTNFSFTVGAGATNLSLVISNSATVYSHMYLKRGGPAATNDFDFVARLNGQTNQINLELPEFAVTNYGLRVVTPATSLQHAFNLVLTTNAPGFRNPLPALKPVLFSTTGSLVNGGGGAWNYFQVDVPTNLTSGWRIVLTHTGAGRLAIEDEPSWSTVSQVRPEAAGVWTTRRSESSARECWTHGRVGSGRRSPRHRGHRGPSAGRARRETDRVAGRLS